MYMNKKKMGTFSLVKETKACSAGKKYIYTQKESISNEYESS